MLTSGRNSGRVRWLSISRQDVDLDKYTLLNNNYSAFYPLLTSFNYFKSYKIFHSEQLECVCKYPDKIKNQLNIYDHEICCYFAVDRNKPQTGKKVMIYEVDISVIVDNAIKNGLHVIILYLYILFMPLTGGIFADE